MIEKAYVQDVEWKQQILDGQYHLMNADGSILLAAFWDSLIEPGAIINMQFSPAMPPGTTSLTRESIHGLSLSTEEDDPAIGFSVPTVSQEKPPEEPEAPVNQNGGVQPPDPNVSSSAGNSGYLDSYVTDVTQKPVDPSPVEERLAKLQAEVDATVSVMRDNINKVSERGERLDSLQDKTDNLAVSAQAFRRAANRRQTSNGLWDSVFNWFSAPTTPSTAHDMSTNTESGTSYWGAGLFGAGRKELVVERRTTYNGQSEIVEAEWLPARASSPPVDEVDEILREWTTVLE